MMKSWKREWLAASAVALLAAGCATKSYVRQSMTEVRGEMSGLEQRMEARADENANLAGTALAHADAATAGIESARDLALGWTNAKEVGRYRLYFGFDRAELDDASRATLDEAAMTLEDHPNYAATLFGYADPTGDENYNYGLAARRAAAVERYLIERAPGDLMRTRTISFGEMPPASEADGLGDGADRRQVVVVLYERVPLSAEGQVTSVF